MFDISILVPSIRTQNWERLYDSIAKSCTKYNWELVFVGPFIDEQVIEYDNVKHIQSYATIPICMQKATLECEGKLIFHTVDDGVLLPESLNICIDYYNDNCRNIDVLNMRYREGDNFNVPTEFVPEYWKVKSAPWEYGLAGINQEWSLSVQPLFSKDLFVGLGGFECSFEYTNHCHHDFIFRVQQFGGKIYHSPVEVSYADHFPGREGDHAPIHDAQTGPDTNRFREIWGNPTDRVFITYDNWEYYLKFHTWKRRFDGPYHTYKELCEKQGYKF
jgi:hypothetical protein